MREQITLEMNREEMILLAGILLYSSGGVLTEVYQKIFEKLSPKDWQRVDQVATQIAINGNGYYIDEDDLLYEIIGLDKEWN